jgi:hypothetical protein
MDICGSAVTDLLPRHGVSLPGEGAAEDLLPLPVVRAGGTES